MEGEEDGQPTTRRRLLARQAKPMLLVDEQRVEESSVSPARISSALKRKANIKVEDLYLQGNYKEPLPTPLETIFESPQHSRSQRGECAEAAPLMARRKLKRLCVFGSHYQPSRTKLKHRRDRAYRMKQLRGVRVPMGKAFSEDDVQMALSSLVEDEEEAEEQMASLPHSSTDSVMESVTQDLSFLQMDCKPSLTSPGPPSREQRRKRRSGLVTSPSSPISAPPVSHPAQPPSARGKKLKQLSGLVFVDTSNTLLVPQDVPGDRPPHPGPSKATGSQRKKQKTSSEAEQSSRSVRMLRTRSGKKRDPDNSPASAKKKQCIPDPSLETPPAPPSQRCKTRGKSKGKRRMSGTHRPLYATNTTNAYSPDQSLSSDTSSPAVHPTNTTSPAVHPTNTPSPAVHPTNTPSPAVHPTNTLSPAATLTNTPSPAVHSTNTLSPASHNTSTPSPAVNTTFPAATLTNTTSSVATPTNTPSPAAYNTNTTSPAITPSLIPSPALIPTHTPSPALIPTHTPSPALIPTHTPSQAMPTTPAMPTSPNTDKEPQTAAPGVSPTSPCTRMAALSLQCTPPITTKPRKARRRSARLSIGVEDSEELRKMAHGGLGTLWLSKSPTVVCSGGGGGGVLSPPQPSVKRRKDSRRRFNQFLLPYMDADPSTTATTAVTSTLPTVSVTCPETDPTSPMKGPLPNSPFTHPLHGTPTQVTHNGIGDGRDAGSEMGKIGANASPHISEGFSPSLSPALSKSDIQNIAILGDFSDLTTPSPADLPAKTPTATVLTPATPQNEELPPPPLTPPAGHTSPPNLTPYIGEVATPLTPSTYHAAPDLTPYRSQSPTPKYIIPTVTPSAKNALLTPNGDIAAPLTPSTSQATNTPAYDTREAHRDQHINPEEEWDSPIVSGIMTNKTLIRLGRVYYGSQLSPTSLSPPSVT